MAHDEINARTDLPPADMALQEKLGTLQEQRGLGGMFLGLFGKNPTEGQAVLWHPSQIIRPGVRTTMQPK